MTIYRPRHRISDHFLYYEVVKSSTASRLGIDNSTQSVEIIENASALAENCFEKIRDQFGPFGPQSWFRGEELEKVICWGRRDNSSFGRWCRRKDLPINDDSWDRYFSRKSHPLGSAGDIEIPGVANDALFEWCRKNLEFDQLIREFPKKGDPMSGWVHISYSKDNNRHQYFTIGG